MGWFTGFFRIFGMVQDLARMDFPMVHFLFLNEILRMVQSVGWFEMVALVSIYHEENTWIP